jgi:rubredoxin
MKFTYEVNLACSQWSPAHLGECSGVLGSEPMETPEEGRKEVLAEATGLGWLQIGDEVWCPACAARRPQVEEIERLRAGMFVPAVGMLVRFEHPQAGAIGHQLTAAENLTLGKVYTVGSVMVNGSSVVMLTLKGIPWWFNAGHFEEVKP